MRKTTPSQHQGTDAKPEIVATGLHSGFSNIWPGLPHDFEHLASELITAAQQAVPYEVCGFVVSGDKTGLRLSQTEPDWQYIPAQNISARAEYEFCIAEAELEMITSQFHQVVLFHSHPFGPACPSAADIDSAHQTGLPWLGVSYVNEQPKFFCLNWPQPMALVTRFYLHGVWDCYSLIRDYYHQIFRHILPDFPRGWGWWQNGLDLYQDHYREAGFTVLPGPDESPHPLQHGDVFLAAIRSDVPNHAGLYLGRGLVFHHLAGRLEHDPARRPRCESAERWQGFITGWLRHEAFLTAPPPAPRSGSACAGLSALMTSDKMRLR